MPHPDMPVPVVPDTDDTPPLAALTEAERAALAADAADAPDAAEPAPALGPEPTARPTPQPTPAPAPEARDPRLLLARIAEARTALAGRLEDGAISARDYAAGLDRLYAAQRAIEGAVMRAAITAEVEQRRDEEGRAESWGEDVAAFLDRHPAYAGQPVLYQALDRAVRVVAADAAQRGEPVDGAEILERAHRTIAAAIAAQQGAAQPGGVQPGVEAAAPLPPAPLPPTPPPHAPLPPRRAPLPPTLGRVPAAETADVSGGRYAVLERLAGADPAAYEAALARMSDAERADLDARY